MKHKIIIFLSSLCLIGCSGASTEKIDSEKPQAKVEDSIAIILPESDSADLQTTISFNVKAKDKKDFEDGIIPWASIEKPEEDIPNLIDGDKIILTDTKITVVIDYPLTNPYEFELNSANGFTRAPLLREISKNYFKIYKEEESSATVKTEPVEKRPILNRNATNGKYGICCHDISDLVLSGIEVYKTANGKIVLSLNIES